MSVDLSRVENILETILGRSEITEPAQSRVEELLIELKEAIEEGGTGGDITALTARIAKCERDISSLATVDETQAQQIQSIVTSLGELRSDIGEQAETISVIMEDVETAGSTLTNHAARISAVEDAIEFKVDKIAGKGLSTNDFTTAEKEKLADIDVGAIDSALSSKADKSSTYTKTEVDSALSNKQNTIPDLSTIRSGAALGATAVQPVTGKGLSANDFTDAEKTKLDNHVVDTSNPHQVTKAQVGLGNVDNTSDYNKPVSTAVQTEFNVDRAAITELLDSGTKNMLQISCSSQTINGVVFTVNDDGTITAEIPGNTTETTQLELTSRIAVPERWKNKMLMLSGSPTGGGSSTWRMVLQNATSGYSTIIMDVGYGMPFTVPDGATRIRLIFTVYANCPAQTITIKPMVCTVSAWNVSQQYVPYRPSYDELVARVEALEKAGE